VANAPAAVIERERKKQSDSEEKIATLKASLEELRKNYKGHSVTFSTTRDALTNVAWAQSGKEISFKDNYCRKDIGTLYVPIKD